MNRIWISEAVAGYTSLMMTHPMIVTVQTPVPPHDTVAVLVPSNFLSTAEAVSTIVLALAVLGVLLACIVVLMQLRKVGRSVTEVARSLEKDARPVMERARTVAENVDFITAAVRTDVQKLNQSVARLNDRLKEASERMEDRIQDFTALVEVLQSEAEGLALDTAAAVRGVRAGTRNLARGEEVSQEEQDSDAFPLLPVEGEDRG